MVEITDDMVERAMRVLIPSPHPSIVRAALEAAINGATEDQLWAWWTKRIAYMDPFPHDLRKVA